MKRIQRILVCFLACTMIFSLCACGGNDNNNTSEIQTYSIQYTDNTGIHTIEVQSGKLYSISSIPEKSGYEFMGLYDAEVGGTQYVNAGGSAVSVFTDNKSIVLYPQFKAKEYTLVLDYQGATVTGSRSMKVAYGSEIAELPLNLTLEHKVFAGWYTEPDRKGVQVADQYGIIPLKNIVNENTFDLTNSQDGIYLYAGFKSEEYTVTFYITESGAPEEVKVEYGTSISDVQLETRIDGKAVLVWSKKRNDTNKEQAFTGKVTSEMVLYAAEFAPVIDFDSNGGNSVNSIIARAGDAIIMPTPVRENYKFVGWQTTGGTTFNATTMPTNSTKLTAKWQAMIIFDTNGGTDVTNISEPQGTRIALPETEKAGYMFAGWYDGNGEKYTASAMPSVSVKLHAKYRKIQTKVIVLIEEAQTFSTIVSGPIMDSASYKELDLNDLYNSGVRNINISIYYECCASPYRSWYDNPSSSNPVCTYMSWYSTRTASDVYKVWEYNDKHIDTNYISSQRNTNIQLSVSKFYICFYSKNDKSYTYYNICKNFYVEIEYPDMNTLY